MQEKIENTSGLSAGDILYEARVSKGESIEAISKKLRINSHFLEALEKNDDSIFPGQAFRIGFLKTYAQYLNLDPKDLFNLIKKNGEDNFVKTDLHFPRITPERMFPSKKIVYVCVFVLIFLGTNFSFNNYPPTTEEKVESLKETQTGSINQNTSINVEQQKTEEHHETHHQSPYAQFKALGKCWIEIRQKEKGVIFDKMLEVGEKFKIEFSPEKSLKIGNAGGIQIMINGEPSGPLGEKGDVISNIPLDSKEKFLNYIQSIINR